jgi:hypothetical protein
MSNEQDSNSFYCDMTALSPQERASHQERLALLFGQLVREKKELANGFAFRFEGQEYTQLAEFIRFERKCCPFLSFELELAPHNGPVWLHLTGLGDIKPFLEAEFGLL